MTDVTRFSVNLPRGLARELKAFFRSQGIRIDSKIQLVSMQATASVVTEVARFVLELSADRITPVPPKSRAARAATRTK